jgi:hypothetical protein
MAKLIEAAPATYDVFDTVTLATTTVTVPTLTASINETSPAPNDDLTLTTNADEFVTFQWKKNGANVPGQDTDSFTGTSVNGDLISCVLTAPNQTPVETATVTVGTAPTALLLDGRTDIEAAFAYFRLRTAYTGPLVRVRRSSDNAQQDIGYNGSNLLDTTALATFLGSSDGFLVTEYDQSGNGRHVTQATAAAQPRIATAGTVNLVNGRPAPEYDGVDDRLDSATGLTLTINSVLATARRINDDNDSGRVFEFSEASTAINMGYNNSGAGFSQYASKQTVGVGTGAFPTARSTLVAVGQDVGSSRLFINGTQNAIGTAWGTGAVTANPITTTLRIGDRHGGSRAYMRGNIMEKFFFSTSINTTDRQAMEAAIAAYYS